MIFNRAIPDCPIDSLDRVAYYPNLGEKLGIDATKKRKVTREWPDVVEMIVDVKKEG